jgi:hypothetical protein
MDNFGRVIELENKSSVADKNFTVKNLHITFDVQDQTGEEPAQGRVRIYNLPPEKRRKLRFQKLLKLDFFGDTMIIKAGYTGNVKQIYEGVSISAINRKEGPNWITDILLVPEIARILNAQIPEKDAKTYPAGTPKITILLNILSAFNIPISGEERQKMLNTLGGAGIRKATTVYGSAKQALDKLSSQWRTFINPRFTGNKMIGLVPGQVLNENNPIVIKEGNLIGTPEILDSGIRFGTRLNPDVALHKLVDIQSKTTEDLTTSGKYATVNVNHRGDNRQGDFITMATGVYTLDEQQSLGLI